MSPSPPLLREPPLPQAPHFPVFSSSLFLPGNCCGVPVQGFGALPSSLLPLPMSLTWQLRFFFSSASPVVYPAGGCDVRDAQQQKITTSPSATRWPLARALFIYLFRDAGGGGRQPKGTTSRCRSLSGGRGGPQGCAWRGLGPARGRGGLGGVSRLQHWRGSGRSPKRRNLLLFIVWQLHAVLAARPSPASACVCARVRG